MTFFQGQSLSILLGKISSLSSSLPFLAGLFTYRKLTTPMRLLFALFLIAAGTDIVGVYLRSQGIQNIWLFTVYIIVEPAFLLWIISYWYNSLRVKQLSFIGLGLYSLFVIGCQIIWGPGALYLEINAVRSVLLSIAMLYTMLNLEDIRLSFVRDHRFWVLTAYFVYFTGTAVMYTAGLFTTMEVYGKMYAIAHSGLNIPSNIVIAGAFLLCHRR
ncbi:MAG: hypothetical protein MAGBODY4_00407 [Candidatus Marinimicrobia bacterium]|nr:hypothetical protein [Candidatus Neomarinimicrobiota bacterium]